MGRIFLKSLTRRSILAFTLTELLVILGVVPVLIVLLLPWLTATRIKSQNAVCTSNLMQFIAIYTMYSNDFDDWLCPPENICIEPIVWNPPGPVINIPYPTMIRNYTHDTKIIDPYDTHYSAAQREWSPISGNYWGGSTILQCPSNPNLMYYTFSVHYGMNSFPWIYGAQADPKTHYTEFNPSWWRRNQVVAPSKVMLLADSDASLGGVFTNGLYGHRIPNNPLSFGQWHDNGTNLLFFDGHVEWWPVSQLTAACQARLDIPPWYASMVPVHGTVGLQDFTGDKTGKSVTVEIRNPSQQASVDNYSATLDAAGNYSIETPWKGSYRMKAKVSHWLGGRQDNVSIDRPGPVTVSFSLTNGDCDGDNEVTSTDQSIILAVLGAAPTDTNWDPAADLDGDGEVTDADLGIALAHIDAMGD